MLMRRSCAASGVINCAKVTVVATSMCPFSCCHRFFALLCSAEPSALPTPTTSYSPTATATPCPSFHPDWHDYWARHRPADSRDEDEAVEWCTRWQHWQQVLLDGDAPSFSRTSVPTRTRTKQPRSDGGDQPQPPRRTPTRTPLKHGGGGGVRNAGSYKLRSGAWAGGSDAGGAFVDFGRDGGASALRNRYRDGN